MSSEVGGVTCVSSEIEEITCMSSEVEEVTCMSSEVEEAMTSKAKKNIVCEKYPSLKLFANKFYPEVSSARPFASYTILALGLQTLTRGYLNSVVIIAKMRS